MSNKVTLTDSQKNELIEQYVDIVVDNMDVKSMMQYITDDLRCHFESVSLNELKDEVDNHDEELFDELVDNVTTEDNAPIIINLPEGTNLTRVIRSDDDYASKLIH
jgi:hypothetical protein